MSEIEKYLSQEFVAEKSVWEKLLRSELKIDDISSKIVKKSRDLGEIPTLSSGPTSPCYPKLAAEWKKSSQTYFNIDLSIVADDLENGVKVFFIYPNILNQPIWENFISLLENSTDCHELVVILLGNGEKRYTSKVIQVIYESQEISGRFIHEKGGDNTLELSYITNELRKKILKKEKPLYFFTFLDSKFFRNISKIRALKYLISRIFEMYGLESSFKIIALTSLREWTFFERYSNILRNNMGVASGLISDADFIQSTGYQFLFEISSKEELIHRHRSLRLARNSFHILSLESMLSIVQDGVSGSFHVEGIAQQYAQLSWEKMQQISILEATEEKEHLKQECFQTFTKTRDDFHLRKIIISGVNDYANIQDDLGEIDFSKITFSRTSQLFEELRYSFTKLMKKPRICLGVLGESALLNARINFCKNYFETMGLEVFESQDLKKIESHKEVVVLCSLDENYPAVKLNLSAKNRYVAGKIQLDGFKNIYVGQNIYEVLKDLYQDWSVR